MRTKIHMYDFEIHTTPLEKINVETSKIEIFLDDINEDRYLITICPFQAIKIVTIDCFSILTYYNEYCFRDGIYHTHILEIEDSEWIDELRRCLTDEHATFLNEAKHFVLPLQDNAVEFVSKDFSVVKLCNKEAPYMRNGLKAFFDKAAIEMPNKLIVSDTGVLWLPLAYCKKAKITLGIAQDGIWLYKSFANTQIIEEPKSFMYVMVFLEMSYVEIKNSIMSNIIEIDQTTDIREIFPFFEIIKFVLEYNISDYWFELALNWFDELNASDKIALKSALEKSVNCRRLHQRTRHRIQKEIKKLRI